MVVFGKKHVRFDLAAANAFHICYVAWYAGEGWDCEWKRVACLVAQSLLSQHASSLLSTLGSDSLQLPAYLALLADCEHQEKPLTEGHRLCLRYSLYALNCNALPSAARPSGGAVEIVQRAVQDWGAAGGGPEKLCYLLQERWVLGAKSTAREKGGCKSDSERVEDKSGTCAGQIRTATLQEC